jgi:hypothetical protein
MILVTGGQEPTGREVSLLCSAHHDELASHRNAIDAARARIAHLGRSSILGADPASATSPARAVRTSGSWQSQPKENRYGKDHHQR